PLFNANPSSLTFNGQLNGGAPPSQNVTISSTSGTLPLVIGASTNNTGSWLSAPATGTTGTAFSVAVNPAGLAPGADSGSITMVGAAANSPLTIPVAFKVANDPLVVAAVNGCTTPTVNSTCPVVFPVQTGQVAPPAQTIKVTSSTGVPLNYTATAVPSGCGSGGHGGRYGRTG